MGVVRFALATLLVSGCAARAQGSDAIDIAAPSAIVPVSGPLRKSCQIANEMEDKGLACVDVRCSFVLRNGTTQIVAAMLCAKLVRKEI